mmetsp:Transcript_49076/g.78165  ORF Transcript_49076/g.78165 Transcript_49076/m.78165 type:complete len:106 (+) Transcript_49076:3-320(+)
MQLGIAITYIVYGLALLYQDRCHLSALLGIIGGGFSLVQAGTEVPIWFASLILWCLAGCIPVPYCIDACIPDCVKERMKEDSRGGKCCGCGLDDSDSDNSEYSLQ